MGISIDKLSSLPFTRLQYYFYNVSICLSFLLFLYLVILSPFNAYLLSSPLFFLETLSPPFSYLLFFSLLLTNILPILFLLLSSLLNNHFLYQLSQPPSFTRIFLVSYFLSSLHHFLFPLLIFHPVTSNRPA